MARGRGPLRYVTGTAGAFGVHMPARESNAGGLLMLLLGAYLLLALITGRLEWLTNAISDTFETKERYSSPPTPPPPQTTPTTANYPRPRTAVTVPVYA